MKNSTYKNNCYQTSQKINNINIKNNYDFKYTFTANKTNLITFF